MRRTTDVLRLSVAALLAFVVASACVVALMRTDLRPDGVPALHMSLISPHAAVVAAVGTFASFTLAWTYATWFDELLRGPSLWRGAQFGVFAWIWLIALIALVTQSGWIYIGWKTWMWIGVQTGLPLLVHGIVLGSVYGTRHVEDEYTFGLGYGVTDRRSLG